jgi:hypothetical protein
MPTSDDETPLAGGNINAGVVRVGETVRRSISPNSRNVHRLLEQLERRGFADAPRFLGIDDQGREILSYMSGTATIPQTLWTNTAALIEAAQMLRNLHDATRIRDFAPDGNWAYTYPLAERNDVICHNDFAPYNMIFRDSLPVAIIDFDLAGPGPHLRDVAYLAYWFAPLSYSSEDLAEQSACELAGGNSRLKLLCAVYGTSDYAGLLDMVSEVLEHMGDETAVEKMVGRDAATRLREGGHFEHWKKEARSFRENRPAIWRNLR